MNYISGQVLLLRIRSKGSRPRQRTGLCAHWAGGASTKSYHGHRRSHRAHTKQHRAGIGSVASGQCEVLAQCERTIELPQNAEMGAPRADASDGEKAGVKPAKMLKYI